MRSLIANFIALLLVLPAVALRAADTNLTTEQLDFFEKHVRPVLSDNCYRCHSQDSPKIRGGLLLDTRAGWLKGGDTGPAIVPGDPDKSLLIKAIRYTDKDLQMPPADKKLATNLITDLETWVKMGAPDPRTQPPDSHPYKVDFAKAKEHWSFKPVTDPAPPQPDDPGHWARSPVDKFILAAMQSNGLTPSPMADKVTLLRRATFDLIGLPPTEQETADFLADNSTNAFATVVDRLLASPHYGERWGRYWLDLSHYADTRGLGNQNDIYPYAYTYRDYVVRAFNDDLPYDQFLIQQIAADRLPTNDDQHVLAAMGYLTLGNRFNNQPNDIIDDRIDIVSKSTMALTVTCARCHDHKFDPIPTTDYYALHGIFNSSVEPKEEPLLAPPDDTPAYRDFVKQDDAKQAALDKFRGEMTNQFRTQLIKQSGEYLLALREFQAKSNDVSRNVYMEKRGLNAQIAGVWDNNLRNLARRHNPIFAPWFALSQLTDEQFAAQAKDLAAKFHDNNEPGKPINLLVAKMFDPPPASLAQVAAGYTKVFEDVEKQWNLALEENEAQKKADTNAVSDLKALPDIAQEQVRQFMNSNNSPMFLDENRLNNLINRDQKLRNTLNDLQKALSDLVVNHPGSPPRACVLADAPKPADSYVAIKGNPGNRGPLATRHFLSILSGDNPTVFKKDSGRLELAQDIASKDNPLTARVMVNRIWLHHFGEGLVRTPDDFGERGETPTHPELLDYLASRFMESGWSIKQMHRLIMLSSTYQQSSESSPQDAQKDPDNRWLWRMNRRLLDFESLRDTVLALGGDLDLTMGGRPVKLEVEPFPLRRSIYGFVDRRNVPNMFQAFDFSSPDLTTGQRETSVVPQQALFMMNSPLVVEQSRNVVRNLKFTPQMPAEARVRSLYNLIFQREPSDEELKLALDYLREDVAAEWQTNAQAAWSYGYGSVDMVTKRTISFVPMATFANGTWLPVDKTPDAKLKGLNLTADGGTPLKAIAAIRRWTSPRDGYISIDGKLSHGANSGDGVHAWIISGRLGALGSWTAFHSQTNTTLTMIHVGKGEVVDFIVDGREDGSNDAFKWPVNIKMARATGLPKENVVEWDSKKDFAGELHGRWMSTWEKFAQVLLETNELMFIN